MAVVTRFAPSPTGLLHIGNVRTALVAWLYARKAGGSFILRLDDTDRERSREEFVQAIEQDLEWLGLGWDRLERQSDRLERYAQVIEDLKAKGRIYPCYETPEELERRRKLQLARHKPPVYDRAALSLSDADRQALESEGRRPHWRFLLDHETVGWTDLVRGPVEFDMSSLSDPVVIRSDGTPLYHLCSVVDDIDLGITHVVRGEDHVTNTAEHVQMFRALGSEPPAFAHLALLTGAGGEGLSKRLGSLGIASLREAGIEALAVTSLLARLGTADPVEPRAGLDEVIEGFDISRFGRAPARFDEEDLGRLNARVLHALPFEAVADRLAALGLSGTDEAFWTAVQGNLETLADCLEWWRVVNEPIAPVIENQDLTTRAAELLPDGDLDEEAWGKLTGALKSEMGVKGKALFHPLRLALTARERGPEMKNLLPLIGSTRAKARLRGETA
jgi:glutamyl-tRNA synthetase